MRQEVCVRRRVLSDEEQEQVFVTKRVVVVSDDPANRFAAGANMTQVERRVVKLEKPSYLSAPFQTMAPVKVWLGGADAAYPTGGALAPVIAAAPAIPVAPAPALAPAGSAAKPGAITATALAPPAVAPGAAPPPAPPEPLRAAAAAPLALPAEGQGGIAGSLAPATGQPLVLTAPGSLYQAGSVAGALRPATSAAPALPTADAVAPEPVLSRAMPGWPVPKARPARR
jgi:hypothetical protein